jgi:hypothetical protein
MLQFPVGEEIDKIGRAMPRNGQSVDGDIKPLPIGELVEWKTAWGGAIQVVPQPLDDL